MVRITVIQYVTGLDHFLLIMIIFFFHFTLFCFASFSWDSIQHVCLRNEHKHVWRVLGSADRARSFLSLCFKNEQIQGNSALRLEPLLTQAGQLANTPARVLNWKDVSGSVSGDLRTFSQVGQRPVSRAGSEGELTPRTQNDCCPMHWLPWDSSPGTWDCM